MFGALLIFYILTGCADSGVDSRTGIGDEYLIRIGDRVATVTDFNRSLEIVKTAYPHNSLRNHDKLRDIQLRLLNQMIEEMILLERAAELNIRISDTEVEKAVADIKADYDGAVFEQTLLEHAIPYSSWEKGLKARLLMEKVVTRELEEQIDITREDIVKYHKEHYLDTGNTTDLDEESDEIHGDIYKMIVKRLRREKAEQAYKPWIKKLQKKYLVEINMEQWGRIVEVK
ncbi:MAG: hypothetical protein BA864_12380 [Desulfuromonadales bacterium C00003093]|nr:MAG: hypothetical protein BA864_12380 [Desulfuromonadales bacterium C00003093]